MLEDVGTPLMPSNILQHVPTSFQTPLFIYSIDLLIDNIDWMMLENILALSDKNSLIKNIFDFKKCKFFTLRGIILDYPKSKRGLWFNRRY